MMLTRLFLILLAVVSVGGCKAAKENTSVGDEVTEQNTPGSIEKQQKTNAIAKRLFFEIKGITPIAMTDDMLTLRISYVFNQGVARTQQFSIPLKKGEAKSQDYSNWLGANSRTQMELLSYRSRVVYETGDMFGFSFQLKKPFDGGREQESQAMLKFFVSESSVRPTIQVLKTKFEYPAQTEMRVWLNE